MSSKWKRGFGWGVGILTFLSVDLPSKFFACLNHFKGLQEDLDDSQSRFSNILVENLLNLGCSCQYMYFQSLTKMRGLQLLIKDLAKIFKDLEGSVKRPFLRSF